MEIKLNVENKLNIFEMRKEIFHTEIDFSLINTLKGNKELLDLTFQQTKKEMLENYG
jgi:hypothetical protein